MAHIPSNLQPAHRSDQPLPSNQQGNDKIREGAQAIADFAQQQGFPSPLPGQTPILHNVTQMQVNATHFRGQQPQAQVAALQGQQPQAQVAALQGQQPQAGVAALQGHQPQAGVAGIGGFQQHAKIDELRGHVIGTARPPSDRPQRQASSQSEEKDIQDQMMPSLVPQAGAAGQRPAGQQAAAAAQAGPSHSWIGKKMDQKVDFFLASGDRLSEEYMNPADEEDYTAGAQDIRMMIMRNFTGGQDLSTLDVRLRSGTITYSVGGGAPQFVTVRDLYEHAYQNGGQNEGDKVESTLENMWRIARRYGAQGIRVSALDPVRGSSSGGPPVEKLAEKSEVVKKIPHGAARLSAFAKPTEIPNTSFMGKWRKAEAGPSSLMDLAKSSGDSSSSKHNRRVVKEMVRGEAFHRHLIANIDHHCDILNDDLKDATKAPDHVKIRARRQKFLKLKNRLEKEHDAMAFHWANVFKVMPPASPAAAAKSDEEKALEMEEQLKRLLAEKAGINPLDLLAQEKWYTSTPEGIATADYAREAAGLFFSDPQAYAKWCHDHHVSPHQPGITSFLFGCLHNPAPPVAAVPGPVPLMPPPYDYISLQMGFDMEDMNAMTGLIDKARVDADKTRNMAERKIGDDLGQDPHGAPVVPPPAAAAAAPAPAVLPQAPNVLDTPDVQIAALIKNAGAEPDLDILKP